MQRPTPQLTAGVAARIAGLGSDGDTWAAGLSALLDEVEHRWSVSVGESLARGTAAFVAKPRRVDGSPAVVKVAPPWPDTDFTHEVSTLAAADGIGYVLLLEHALTCTRHCSRPSVPPCPDADSAPSGSLTRWATCSPAPGRRQSRWTRALYRRTTRQPSSTSCGDDGAGTRRMGSWRVRSICSRGVAGRRR